MEASSKAAPTKSSFAWEEPMPGCSKCKPSITDEGLIYNSLLNRRTRSVTMDKQYTDDDKNTLKRILDLSWRISDYAPPMKPFLRFSKHAETLYKGKTNSYKHFFWDFDDALQKVLLGMARTCLLYTSDAADDLLCVDLGGRRIIKK